MTRTLFESQQRRRFGTANPERMPLAFWEWMVRKSEEGRIRDWTEESESSGHTPYQLRVLFGQEGDYSKGPVWTFDRMGATPHAAP